MASTRSDEARHAPDLGAVTIEELRGRRSQALAIASERGFDGLLVFSAGGTSLEHHANNFYLAGVHSPSGNLPDTTLWEDGGLSVLLLDASSGECVLVINGGGLDTEGLGLDGVEDTSFVIRSLVDLLRSRGLDRARLGVDGFAALSARSYRRLLDALGEGSDLVDCDGLVARMRRVKSPAEIEQLRKASHAGVAAVSAMMSAVAEGRTEAEVVAEAFQSFTGFGGAVLDIPVGSGPDSLRLWGGIDVPNVNAARMLKRGDLFHADFFGALAGYFTDFARSTVVGGAPSPSQLEVLQLATGAVEDCLVPAMRPGVTGGDVYSAARERMIEEGGVPDGPDFEENYPLLGHGTGLSILEAPLIAPDDPTPLEMGMVICAEVFATGDAGGAYFEQVLLITEEGPEILSGDCPTAWW